MRRCETVSTIVALTALLSAPSAARAQTAGPATNISSVVRGGVVTVSYDLVSSNPAAEFTVSLEASSDGGKTYAVHPRTLKGDFGPSVRQGAGKQITWEAAKDVENLDVDRYRYRVIAQPRPGAQARSQLNAQPPAAQAPTAQAPSVSVPTSSGKGRKWVGLGLIGGGAFFAVIANTNKTYDHETDTESMNKPLFWSGIAMAGGGVALMSVGGSSPSTGTHVLVRPSGVGVLYRMPLGRVGRQ